MKLAGFNFTKISIERFPTKMKNLKISTKIDISEIKEIDSNFLKSEEIFLSINFKYNKEF